MKPTENLQQGGQEWLNERKGRITASKLPVIMGLSPYQTPYGLWCEELGLIEPKQSSWQMEEGLRNEEEARKWFSEQTSTIVKPVVKYSDEVGCSMASLDGMNEEETIILEIKSNNAFFHEMAKYGKIPEFHQIQMQAQMFVTGSQHVHYLSYKKGDECIVVLPRNDMQIANLIEAGRQFKHCLETLIPPPLTDQDYVDVTDNVHLTDLAQRYKYYFSLWKEFESKCQAVKEEIRLAADDRNVKGLDFKMTKYAIKGRLDYDTIISQFCPDVNLDQYRKPNTIGYRITVE
jgi:putative phage-type endonuclease